MGLTLRPSGSIRAARPPPFFQGSAFRPTLVTRVRCDRARLPSLPQSVTRKRHPSPAARRAAGTISSSQKPGPHRRPRLDQITAQVTFGATSPRTTLLGPKVALASANQHTGGAFCQSSPSMGGGHQGGPVPVWGGWAAGRRGEVSPLINTSSSSVLFCPAGAGEERTPQFSLGGWRGSANAKSKNANGKR